MDKYTAKIIRVLKKYGVVRASLFGSVITGKMTDSSDIDILVKMPLKATLFDMLGIKVDLEEKLGRKVDVIEYEGIKPTFRKEILSHQVTIYQQP